MTDTTLHVPAHIQMTLRIATQEQHTATGWTAREVELKGQLDEHQRDATRIRKEIEAELQRAAAAAQQRLDGLDEVERKLTRELAEAGRCREHHGREALDAQQTVADWCTRHGVSPVDLPQPDVTGPLPALTAAPAPVVERPAMVGTFIDSAGQLREGVSPCAAGRSHNACSGCDQCPDGCHDDPFNLTDSTPERAAEITRATGGIPVVAPVPPSDPLATRVDPLPGGDPAQGPFPDDGTEGPGLDQRPHLPGVSSDEQDGADRG